MKKLFPITIFVSLFFAIFTDAGSRRPQQVGGDIGMKYFEAVQITSEKAILGETSISFTGNDAESLFNSLPEPSNKNFSQLVRGFNIFSKEASIEIKCEKKEVSSLPKCLIQLNKPQNHSPFNLEKWISQ